MKRKSIFTRVFRGYLLVILLVLIIVPIMIYSTVRSRFTEAALDDLERTASALCPLVSSYIESSSFFVLDSIIDDLGSRLGIRITVIARDGMVLADSEKNPDEMENHRTRTEVIQAFNGMTGSSSRYSETLRQEMLYSAVPVIQNDSIPMVVRTSFFSTQIRTTFYQLAEKIFFAALVVLSLATAIAWFHTKKLTEPIRMLAEVSTRVKNGNFSARAGPSSTSELNELSISFNDTIARIQDLVENLSTRNKQDQAILQSIVEGLAVVDHEGNIIMVNSEFNNISDRKNDSDGTFMETVNSPGIRDFIKQAFEDGTSTGKIESDGRNYICSSATVGDGQRRVFTFRDVTELTKLAKMKKDFAVNVSHELRTPLTSIKGFTETLLENASGDDKSFLEIISRNSERLINLVKDVQTLSEMEDSSTILEIERVNLQDLIEGIIPLFREKVAEKGLDLKMEISKNTPPVRGDRFRLEQVFVNLISNAVNYTDSGTVTVKVKARGNRIVTAVSDTGCGIPQEHQSRIFERFYVVNRSRSRSMGGTGLGLAIVKHIVALHEGSVNVNSSSGSGTIFTVTLSAFS